MKHGESKCFQRYFILHKFLPKQLLKTRRKENEVFYPKKMCNVRKSFMKQKKSITGFIVQKFSFPNDEYEWKKEPSREEIKIAFTC